MAEVRDSRDLAVLMQRAVEAVGARDLEAALGFYAPDAVFDSSSAGLETLQGRPAIRVFFEDWWGVYEHFEQHAAEIRDLGNGVVFVVFVQRARLSGSSELIQLRFSAVTTWADGLIERQTNYLDVEEGRAAAERLAQERQESQA